ncbi:MAG: hypothetical protein JSW60_09650 [Thermoplasmatales archaeon]|nr:MAG: hypothetical protein JSW60_09650 [Thermoplasmatales archaeon]
MKKKGMVHSRKKPTRKKKWMNKPNDDIMMDIQREMDRLANVSKERYMANRSINLFEACAVMNVIFSTPGGSVLIMTGALYSNFIIFIIGIIILLEGIFVCALFGVLRSMIGTLKVMKIRRNIAKY